MMTWKVLNEEKGGGGGGGGVSLDERKGHWREVKFPSAHYFCSQTCHLIPFFLFIHPTPPSTFFLCIPSLFSVFATFVVLCFIILRLFRDFSFHSLEKNKSARKHIYRIKKEGKKSVCNVDKSRYVKMRHRQRLRERRWRWGYDYDRKVKQRLNRVLYSYYRNAYRKRKKKKERSTDRQAGRFREKRDVLMLTCILCLSIRFYIRECNGSSFSFFSPRSFSTSLFYRR